MNRRSAYLAVCCFATVAFGSGCSDRSRAAKAYSEYEVASAAGDLTTARRALLRLVAVDDGVARYWLALAKVQLELGAYADAYYAFTRANELDRGNPQTLSALTQLALLGGKFELAERHAKQLALISPSDPAVRLASGYVALKRRDLDTAEQQADQLLQAFPFDPAAKLLKTRVLLARRMPEDAMRLLEDQVRARPADVASRKALIATKERAGDWSSVATESMELARLQQKDLSYAFLAIEAAFRAGEIERAKQMSQPFLQPQAPPDQVNTVLQVWAQRWKSSDALDEVRRLSRSAGPQQALAFATYFNDVGAADDAAALVGSRPKLPLTGTNASMNAIIATSMALRGQQAAAKQLLDAILEEEPDHLYALRSRVNLKLRAGMPRSAVSDAQRLVTIVPSSARDRLLLSRAHAAAGDRRQVDRTLWNAFHQIPANRDLYQALRSHVERTSGPEGARSLDAEFEQQLDTKLAREFF